MNISGFPETVHPIRKSDSTVMEPLAVYAKKSVLISGACHPVDNDLQPDIPAGWQGEKYCRSVTAYSGDISGK